MAGVEPPRLVPVLPIRGDSPALDAGTSCVPTDARGLNRTGPACDLGAFELTLAARDFRDDASGTLGPPSPVLASRHGQGAHHQIPGSALSEPAGNGSLDQTSSGRQCPDPRHRPRADRVRRCPAAADRARCPPARRRGPRLDLARADPPRLLERRQRRRLARLPARPRSRRTRRATAEHGHARPGAGGHGWRGARCSRRLDLSAHPARLVARRRHRHGRRRSPTRRSTGRLVHADRGVLRSVVRSGRLIGHRPEQGDARVDQPAGRAAAADPAPADPAAPDRLRVGAAAADPAASDPAAPDRHRGVAAAADPAAPDRLRSRRPCGRSRCARSTSWARRCGRSRCARSTCSVAVAAGPAAPDQHPGLTAAAGPAAPDRQPRRYRRLFGVPRLRQPDAHAR